MTSSSEPTGLYHVHKRPTLPSTAGVIFYLDKEHKVLGIENTDNFQQSFTEALERNWVTDAPEVDDRMFLVRPYGGKQYRAYWYELAFTFYKPPLNQNQRREAASYTLDRKRNFGLTHQQIEANRETCTGDYPEPPAKSEGKLYGIWIALTSTELTDLYRFEMLIEALTPASNQPEFASTLYALTAPYGTKALDQIRIADDEEKYWTNYEGDLILPVLAFSVIARLRPKAAMSAIKPQLQKLLHDREIDIVPEYVSDSAVNLLTGLVVAALQNCLLGSRFTKHLPVAVLLDLAKTIQLLVEHGTLSTDDFKSQGGRFTFGRKAQKALVAYWEES